MNEGFGKELYWKGNSVKRSGPFSEPPDSGNRNPWATVCILGALQRHVDLQGVFVKIGDFIKFKGFLVELLENRRS